MATAEEILAGMTAEEMQQVLVIDNDLRRITIPEGVRLLGVTSDDDVLRLRFSMPRVYGEVDLSGFAIRINYLNAGSEGDVYPVDDAQTDGDVIRFTWLVGRHACKFAGDVRFIVCLKRSEGGEVAQEYNTTLATLPVLEGLETGEAVAQAHPDVIEAILRRLDTLEQEGGGVSTEAIAAAVEAYIQEHGVQVEEVDPTVPDWAKQPSKPTYTAGEVGARPDTWTPSASDVGARPDTWTPSASDVGARPDTWMPSAADVGADAAGTASGAVAAHNVSGAAHEDLRALIEGLTSRLNALADSDDTTLDQLSEIVAYIKSNKTLIDAVTTGKVSTGDIVDNLTTNASGKVLSAAQGVALKAMIDGIVIPTALPNPQPITINGQRYDGSEAVTMTTVEIDDTMTQSGKAADAKAVGDQLSALNKAKANNDDLAAVAKSGSYTDLTNKPTIPTVPESLKNPNKLTFTGAVTAEYDGSAPVSVEIPGGGGSSDGDKAWEEVFSFTTTEDVSELNVEISAEVMGRLASVKEFLYAYNLKGAPTAPETLTIANVDHAIWMNNADYMYVMKVSLSSTRTNGVNDLRGTIHVFLPGPNVLWKRMYLVSTYESQGSSVKSVLTQNYEVNFLYSQIGKKGNLVVKVSDVNKAQIYAGSVFKLYV